MFNYVTKYVLKGPLEYYFVPEWVNKNELN